MNRAKRMSARRYLLMAAYIILCVSWSALCHDYSVAPFNIIGSWGAAFFYWLVLLGRDYMSPQYTVIYVLFSSLAYFGPRLFLVTIMLKKRIPMSYMIPFGVHALGIIVAFYLRSGNEERIIAEGMTIFLYMISMIFTIAYLTIDWRLAKKALSIHPSDSRATQ